MTDTTPDTVDTVEPDTTNEPDAPDTEEKDTWTPPDKDAWTKLEQKAAQRDKLLREAQAEIRKLKNPDKVEAEPTEADKLRTGMKRTAARAALATAGYTDKADQAVILEALSLDGVEIGEDGEADTEALEERLTELRRIFGGPAPTKRVPAVHTRDKGGREAAIDPDRARRLRFLTGRQV